MRSLLLVIGQFGSIAVLLAGGDWHLPWWAWALFLLGLGVFAWAALSLGGRNFTIMPEPRAGNELAVRGVYRFIRHPMYTAVLLCGAAVSFGAPSALRWVALPVCTIVLLIKIRHEEALLLQRHPYYQDRMRGVKRLLPLIW